YPRLRLIHALLGRLVDAAVVLLLRVLHAAVAPELLAHRVQLVLVEDHLVAALPAELVGLRHEDRLLGADLLAVAAEDAAQHVDVEDLRRLLDRTVDLARDDRDGARRADELAKRAA